MSRSSLNRRTFLRVGGGIKVGQVIGASDRIGAFPTDPIDPGEIHATMFHCLGLDPHQTMIDHLKRPFPMSTGRVVQRLVTKPA